MFVLLRTTLLTAFLTVTPATAFPDWGGSAFFLSSPAAAEACGNLFVDGTIAPNRTVDQSAAVFACALMLCGHDDHIHRSECSWFRELAHTQDFRQDFQDIKNYLALLELEQAKKEALDQSALPPQSENVLYAGLKYHALELEGTVFLEQEDPAWIQYQLLPPLSQSNNPVYVKNRLQQHCSRFEERLGFCRTRGGDIPYDLLAVGLLSDSTLSQNEQRRGARQYVHQVTSPVPIPLLPLDKIYFLPENAASGQRYDLTEHGKAHLKAKYKHQLFLSVAQEILRSSYVQRLPNNVDPGQTPLFGISDYELRSSRLATLENEITRRVSDARWYADMEQLNITGLLREMNAMMALQMVLNFENSRSMEQIELVAATDMILLHDFLHPRADVSAGGTPASSPSTVYDNLDSVLQGATP